MNGSWHAVPYGLLHGSLCSLSDAMSSDGYRNNPWGPFMTSDWIIWVLRFSIYIFCMCLQLLRPLIACTYGGFFLCVCVGGVIIGAIGVWGGRRVSYCVWWMCWLTDRRGSEDRTSLRGVAVNPWPHWLSLQGGGSSRRRWGAPRGPSGSGAHDGRQRGRWGV